MKTKFFEKAKEFIFWKKIEWNLFYHNTFCIRYKRAEDIPFYQDQSKIKPSKRAIQRAKEIAKEISTKTYKKSKFPQATIDYDSSTDVLYITLGTREPSEVYNVDDRLLIDIGMYSGKITGIEILDVLKFLTRQMVLMELRNQLKDNKL